jgi:DNA-3-methyladenine glycosylase
VKPLVRLARSFYARDAETVARALLGSILVHVVGDEERRARVVETEAYVGAHDLACHASKGRTKRTEVMFGPAGHAYVYLIYGMHQMLNVVTGDVDDAQAVLIRAVEPLSLVTGKTNGPGLVARSLGVTREHDGADLCAGSLFFARGTRVRDVVVTPRINVDYAKEWAKAPLRFYDAKSAFVSRRTSG